MVTVVTGFDVRLGVRDAQTVQAALRQLGTDGEATLRRLETAAKRANSTGFQAIGAGARELQQQAQGLAASLGPVGALLSGLGPAGIAAAAGIALVTAGTFKSIEAFAEAERSILRVNAVLRATGNTTGLTRREIEQLSQSVESSTLFDDKQVRQAASVLATFSSVTGANFRKVIELGGDVAATLGTDIVGEVQKLGQTIEQFSEGEVTRLDRNFKFLSGSTRAAIEDLAKAGDTAGATRLLIEALQNSVGGTASEEASGLSGSWKRFGDRAEAAMERVGGAAATFLQPAIARINTLFSGIEAFGSFVDNPTAAESLGNKIAERAALAASRKQNEDLGIDTPSMDEDKQRLAALDAEIERLRLVLKLEGDRENNEKLASQEAAKRAADEAEALRNKVAAEEVAKEAAKERDRLAKQIAAETTRQAEAETKSIQTARQAVQDQIQGLIEEREQLALTDRQRFIRNELLKAEAQIKKGLIKDGPAYIEQVRKEASALFDAQAAQNAIADADAERTRVAEQAAKERARIAEQEAELMLEPFKNAARGIQDAFAGAFREAFKGNLDDAKDLANRLTDIFAETSAQIAAMLVFRPILNGIAGSALSSGGAGAGSSGGFNLGSLFGGGGGGFDLGSIFGGGGSSGWFPASAGGPGHGPAGGGIAGGATGSGFSWGGAGLTAALNLIPLGLAAASGQKLGGSQIGSAVGGTLGGIAGSFFGPVGSFVGSTIGNLLGGLVGGLFGGSAGKPSGSTYFNVANGGAGGLIGTSKHGGTGDASSGAVKAYGETLNALLAQADLEIMNGRLSGYIQAQQNKSGETNFYGNLALGQSGGPNSQNYYRRVDLASGLTNKDEEGLKNVIAALIAETLKQAAGSGALGGAGATATTLSVLRNTRASSIDALGADLDFAKLYDEIAGLSQPTLAFDQALKEIDARFAGLKEKAEELGLALGPLEQGRLDAIAQLTKDIDEANRRAVLGFTDPLTLALEDFEKAAADRLKEAQRAGADLVLLERRTQLERQAIVDQFTGAQTADLQRFFEEITFGGLSGAGPGGTLSGARAAFEAAAAQAAAGDLTARGRLADLGTGFLTASRNFNASGAGYSSDLAIVQNAIAQNLVGGPGSLQSTIQAGNDNVVRVLVANANELAQLRQVQEDQRRLIADLTTQLSRFLNAV